MNLRKFISALLLPVLSVPAVAQVDEFNLLIHPEEVSTIRLAAPVQSLFTVGDTLYYSSQNLLFATPISDGHIASPVPAWDLLSLNPDLNYAVVSPLTGELYFTTSLSASENLFYRCYTKGDKRKIKKVSLPKFKGSIEHPTFSEDGKIMVFASRLSPDSCSNLYYSESVNGKWSAPRSLGKRINTSGNECAPVIDGAFLFFSSNGLGSGGDYELYATRLLSYSNTFGDTIVQFPIGMSRVSNLGAPINSALDDRDITFCKSQRATVWAVQSADGSAKLFSCAENLSCVRLTGQVSVAYDGEAISSPFPYATIEIYKQDGSSTRSIYSVLTDAFGRYSLYINSDADYIIKIKADGCFPFEQMVNVRFVNQEYLCQEERRSFELKAYRMDTPYTFNGDNGRDVFFRERLSVELSDYAMSRLKSIVQFMNSNPSVNLQVEVEVGDADERLAGNVARARSKEIARALKSYGVSEERIRLTGIAASIAADGNNPSKVRFVFTR